MPRHYDSDDEIRYNDQPEPRMSIDGGIVAFHVLCLAAIGVALLARCVWSFWL